MARSETLSVAQARRIANYAAFFWMKERVGRLIEFDRCPRGFDANALAFLKSAVARIAFGEDDLLRAAELRHALDRVFDVAALVAAGDGNA